MRLQMSNQPRTDARLLQLGIDEQRAQPIAAERDVFVCQKDGRIVGTIALGSDRLRSLFVDPELQQAGIGARLVAHLEAHARKVGVSELKLSSSLTARGFYERLGYRLIQPEEHDGVSTFLMAKALS